MDNQTNTSASDIKGTAGPWIERLRKSEKDFQAWHERVRKINKRYKQQEKIESRKRQYAMLWANIEVMKESVYSQEPQPVVMRRFKDKDPIARVVSEIMERTLSVQQELENDADTYELVRDDFLLGARGCGRVRYEYDPGEPVEDPVTGEEIPTITNERAVFDSVHWSDFRHGPARKWKAVPWVGFREYLGRKKWEKRFSEFPFPSPKAGQGNGTDQDEDRSVNKDKAAVWEIWDKESGKVYWVNEHTENILDESDPPLNFRKFFPCPKPAYGTTTTDNLIPTPDFVYYQDQAEEIDRLTARISSLTDALKLVGFYPSGEEDTPELEKALSPSVENRMIGVKNWAAFAEHGGVDAVVWLPVKDVVAVLRECVDLRRQQVEDVYQITGISDIVRGDTDPGETLGAQQLKSQWGSIRIRRRQKEMARFARDIQELRAEVVAENFQQQTLQEASGIRLPEAGQIDPQSGAIAQPGWKEVMELLRNERMRNYRVDIETDSTIVADEQAEKQARNEFLGAVGGFIQQAVPVIQQIPQMAPVMGEVLLFTVRGYRAGRQIEEKIEEAAEMLAQMAQQPQQQGPSKVDEIVAKGEVDKQLKQLDQAGQMQLHQADAQAQGALQKDQQQHEKEKMGIELIAESQRPQGPALNG